MTAIKRIFDFPYYQLETYNLSKAFTTKYSNRGADKNLVILDSLVSKRYQLAKLMGYSSFAEYNLKPKMAKNPETVWKFIDGLVAESKEKAINDLEVLKQIRNKELKTPNDTSEVNPWDLGYYKNQILKDFLKSINQDDGKLFFIKSNNTRHNIFGLWSIDLMDKLENDLNKGERKVEVWANSIGVKSINMKFENENPFFNINTKDDLKKAMENLEND